MTTISAETDILTQIIQGLGYTSLIDFAREQTKGILQQKIAYYQSRVDFFEQKYGLSFGQFCEQFDQIRPYSLLEKENDSLLWETAIDVIDAYKTDALALNQ